MQTMTEIKTMTGAIRKLSKDGYGFIAADDGNDYFFHWSACDVASKDFRALVVRERVSFSLMDSPKGPRAIQVAVIDDRRKEDKD